MLCLAHHGSSGPEEEMEIRGSKMKLQKLSTAFLATMLFGSINACSNAPSTTQPAAGPTTAPATQPVVSASHGSLGDHPFLFVGEENQNIYMVNGGKVIWTYTLPKPAPSPLSKKGFNELDDIWRLTNGNILFDTGIGAMEITYPDKIVVWHYDGPPGVQIHSVQPIGADRVLLMQNGTPAKMMIFNTITNQVVWSMVVHTKDDTTFTFKNIHSEFRHVRMTAAGTILVPQMNLEVVREYTTDGKIIWSVPAQSPWAAVRLKNGDTLISENQKGDVIEVNPAGKTVWEVSNKDMPPGIKLMTVQGCDRLANGDTLICNWSGKKADWKTMAQVIEVTPDKKVVWVMRDYQDIPAPGTAIQFLDEPGIPEIPGDLQQ
jgi:PQQ-like domain